MKLPMLCRDCLAVSLLAISATFAQAAEIRVLTPGVIANSGLREVDAAFTAKTGIKVTIVPAGMGQIADQLKSAANPSDIIMLPMDLMATADLEKAIKPGGFTPLGRVEIGLFKKEAAPRPDISTPAKLIAVLKSASVVMYSDPASGSMQASMSDQLLKRPDFVGVKGKPVQGDAEPALKRGDGDANAMGLGLVHDAHEPGKSPVNPFLVGPLPAELGEHMDMATAISARATNAGDAEKFIQFMLGPDALPLWQAKGVSRY